MRYTLTDADGDSLIIESCSGISDKGDAFVEARAYIKAHEVPAVCRALYEAAGLPVPDLPDIPDPELVEHLAGDLKDAMARNLGPASEPLTYDGSVAAAARELLARGWGRTA